MAVTPTLARGLTVFTLMQAEKFKLRIDRACDTSESKNMQNIELIVYMKFMCV